MDMSRRSDVTDRSPIGTHWVSTAPGRGVRPPPRPYAPAVTFTVGFDLDMTLIDPRRGMIALFDALAAETGIALDGRAFASRLGPPLRHELARYGLEPAVVDRLVDRFRARYVDVVVPETVSLPGAREALEAVARQGGRAVVVTAKLDVHARCHLDLLGLPVDSVVGSLFGSGKAVALRGFGAEIYVGDHLGDITGARQADAMAVAVATGPITADDLDAAGADVVLPDLTRFPDWLDTYLLATVH